MGFYVSPVSRKGDDDEQGNKRKVINNDAAWLQKPQYGAVATYGTARDLKMQRIEKGVARKVRKKNSLKFKRLTSK